MRVSYYIIFCFNGFLTAKKFLMIKAFAVRLSCSGYTLIFHFDVSHC